MDKKKMILLDIDYTIICPNGNGPDYMGEFDIPRPYLKEFLETVKEKYDIVFYTAADSFRVSNACRNLYHIVGITDDRFIMNLQRDSLSNEYCPMIDTEYGEIKSLESASKELEIPVSDMILIDDNHFTKHPHQNQIITAEPFYGSLEDDYLLRLIIIIDEKFNELNN